MTRILHIEDDPLDHKLVRATLLEGGLEAVMTRVETREGFAAALAGGGFDLVLSDYNLPQFDGREALEMILAARVEVPFIILSGAIGEMAAVEIMKAGATDCVLKERLERLGPAITRALREAEERRARLRAETELRLAKEEAERSAAEAMAANSAKDRFLAALSHELRTPLSPVLMALSAIEQDAELPERYRADLQMMRRNIDLETKLIDDLLDLNRVVSNKLRLDRKVTGVHEIIEHVLESAGPDIAGGKLTVQRDFGAKMDRVFGDAGRLQQVIWNVIRNAIKFTPAGGRIEVRSYDGDAGRVVMEIKDTGIGIPEGELEKIFDAFAQGDASITARFGGLGMGLAIAKAIVEMHEGRIGAESAGVGKGATFRVELPTTVEKSEEGVPGSGLGHGGGGSGKPSILLVEDHQDTGRMLSRLLAVTGYEVHLADCAMAARALAAGHRIDLVVSDIGLPDATGYELMRELKEKYGVKGIALTGYGMEEDVQRSREAGFSDHVVKPVDFEKLERTIRGLVGA